MTEDCQECFKDIPHHMAALLDSEACRLSTLHRDEASEDQAETVVAYAWGTPGCRVHALLERVDQLLHELEKLSHQQ